MNHKALYVACVLTKKAQQELFAFMRHFVTIPANWKRIGHHMTVEFHNAEEAAQDGYFGESIKLGQPFTLIATHYKMDTKGLALVIQRNSELKISNECPHITVAVAPGVAPVYSNEMLAMGDWITLPHPQMFDSYLVVVRREVGAQPVVVEFATDVYSDPPS